MAANPKFVLAAGLGAIALAALPVAAQRAPSSGPVVRYDMRAGTTSGLSGAGGGMSMMFGGGGGKVQHELYLRIGSSRLPDKAGPKADHFMPPAARLGKSVQLVTPAEEREPTEFPEGQKPKGRLLIFWGCGEHAPKGQPVLFDFAKIGAGAMPPGLWTTTVLRDLGPTRANSRTFARWPAEDHKFVKPDSSLIGPHRVVGNYTPEINFTLTKDFMGTLSTSTGSLPSGAGLLRWNALPDATGYFAMIMGGKMGPNGEMGDMVMWSSSFTRQFGGGFGDWLSPGQVAGLVRDRSVLPPSTTTCTIPAEVRAASPGFRMGMLTAFGPEEDFSYPPRPADPKTPWNLEWTARIRHRSTTSWMDMNGMAGMGAMSEGRSQQQGSQCKPRGGLGGMLGGVLGGGGC